MQKIKLYGTRLVLGLLCLLLIPAQIAAQSPQLPVMIIELQTASSISGRDEFIELYNPNHTPIDIAGWQVQYRAATKTGETAEDWRQMVNTIACDAVATGCVTIIQPHGRLTLASAFSALAGALPLARDGMATESGQVRLVSADGLVQDMVGYGQAAAAEGGKPAPSLSASKSLKRRLTEDGYFIDTQVNADNFMGGCTPTPYNAPTTVVPTCDMPPVPSTDDSSADGAAPVATPGAPVAPDVPDTLASPVLPIIITELLPNPTTPDAADEFIELYNANDAAVELAGYKLQAGTDFRYSYTFTEGTVGSHQYVAVYSADSHVTLSNSGGVVRVLGPEATVLDTTEPYGAAKAGQSWMRDGDKWHWTTQLTPAAANVLAMPIAALPVAKSKKSTKVASTAKAKTPAAPKATKKLTSTAATTNKTPSPAVAAAPNPHLWLLLPIGAILVGYVIYEYRQNIARLWRNIRNKMGGARKLRQPVRDA